MFYTLILAVCLSSTPKSECDESTAVRWTPRAEVTGGPGQCAALVLQVLAQTALTPPGTYPAIICQRRFPTPPVDRRPHHG